MTWGLLHGLFPPIRGSHRSRFATTNDRGAHGHLLFEFLLEEARALLVKIWQFVALELGWNILAIELHISFLVAHIEVVLFLCLLVLHVLNGESLLLVLLLADVLLTSLCLSVLILARHG